jgi:hypothetical protein
VLKSIVDADRAIMRVGAKKAKKNKIHTGLGHKKFKREDTLREEGFD